MTEQSHKPLLVTRLLTSRLTYKNVSSLHIKGCAIVAQTANTGATGFKSKLTVWETMDVRGGETGQIVYCQFNNGSELRTGQKPDTHLYNSTSIHLTAMIDGFMGLWTMELLKEWVRGTSSLYSCTWGVGIRVKVKQRSGVPTCRGVGQTGRAVAWTL